MFDITSSKLLILGIVALIVVGPKELPQLLRTIGKYMGIIRRQASEFRAQFDEAMRESELADIKKDVESMGRDMETTMRDAEMSVEREVAQANAELDTAMNTPEPNDPLAESMAGMKALEQTPAAAPAPPPADPAPVAEPVPAKTGA
jgi:sec-independent protein translocase protein TatB